VNTPDSLWRRRWRWRILWSYLGLLALSHFVQWARPPHGIVRLGQQVAQAPVIDDDERPTGESTPLYYLDTRPTAAADTHVLVLLNGSPMRSPALDGLVRELTPDFRLVVPDMPGFGASAGPELPNYSAETQAMQLLALLDQLHIPHANLAGYGFGGDIALEFAELAPTRVQSVTLIDSTGPVEYEWLGDPVLNHALYGAQIALITLAQELLPHFGIMDISTFNEAYAGSYWDTDQRRVRDLLQNYREPMLILHGDNDLLEPVAVAREANRLVPQSELALHHGGHGEIYQHPEDIADHLRDFVRRVQAGQAKTKATARPQRLEEARAQMTPRDQASGVYLLAILALIVLATLIAEDLTCIGAGLLVARGVLGFWMATIACFVGIYIGDLLLYLAGLYFGRPAMRYPPFRWWIKEADLQRMSESFGKRGMWLIFISRFVPASRVPLFIGAGILRFSFMRLAVGLLVAGAVWTPPFVGIAALLGQQMLYYVERYEKAAFAMLLLVVLGLAAVVHVVLPMCTWRGRRLWLSRWRRFTRWEFWPWWMIYPPVFVYVAWLALKHRSLTVFTCANPALPDGGFVEESKSHILRGLTGAGSAVATWTLLPEADDPNAAASRAQLLETWMAGRGLVWPVVLKPDVGERGQGVAVCRDHYSALDYLGRNTAAIIAQEYVPGVEYGVFYYRHPDEKTGHLLAITDKRFPSVTGDGKHNLEYLILKDDRAVCSARFFLARHAARLFEIPPVGEVIPLVELGTHARGALFLDGTADLGSPQLTAAMDAISQNFAGFNFGRYDVRCPSANDLRAGRNLRVIELNGVTSEATAIYDPHGSLLSAWRTLCRQWRICYEIGAANRARGAVPVPLRGLLQSFLHSRTTTKFEV